MSEQQNWADVEVISSYSRAEALDDGVLVDLWAGEMAGVCRRYYKWPVACTAAVWSLIGEIAQAGDITINSALHLLLRASLLQGKREDSRVWFEVKSLTAGGDPQVHSLYLVAGPGDAGEPVLTLMLADED